MLGLQEFCPAKYHVLVKQTRELSWTVHSDNFYFLLFSGAQMDFLSIIF